MKQLLFNDGSGSGGGLDNGTVLWENPNPTAAFNAQNVSLSAPLVDYDFIGVRYQVDPTDDHIYETIFKSTDLALSRISASGVYAFAGAIGSSANNYNFSRNIYRVSDTELKITICYHNGGSNTSIRAIPQQIIGY